MFHTLNYNLTLKKGQRHRAQLGACNRPYEEWNPRVLGKSRTLCYSFSVTTVSHRIVSEVEETSRPFAIRISVLTIEATYQ